MSSLSLYRAYLRQARALPHPHLRLFFRIKGADDFRSVLKTKSLGLRKRKLKRLSKVLRQLRAANQGQPTAFDRMLDRAYGRVGKLRSELIKPFLSNQTSRSLPSESRKEKIGLPIYSPELATLLTSGISRTTKALQKHHLVSPPGLPARADPDSEDAVLMGLLSRRREYNIRWRFFKSEWKKVYPPIQLPLQHLPGHTGERISSDLPANFGFHNTGTLQELLALARPHSMLPSSTGKRDPQESYDTNFLEGSLPVRWIRRRYQALLRKVPLLVLRPSPQNNFNRTYDIQLGGSAITTPRIHSSRLRVADAEDVSWITDVHGMVGSGRCRR